MKNKIHQIILLAGLLFNCAPSIASLDLNYSTVCNNSEEEAVLSFAGDIIIHKELYLSVVLGSRRFDQLWKKTEPLIKKADYSVANLEGPAAMGIDSNGNNKGDIGFVYDGDVYSGTNYVFNFHPRLLIDLQTSGFDLLTLANNHSTDRFSIGIDRTILSARAIGLSTAGTRKSDEAKGEYFKISRIKNMNVAFISCTEYINIPDHDNQVLFCEDQKIFKLIKEITDNPVVDALVILPHWGVEYSPLPRDYQKEYARRYLEAGAIAVIGSHPHVLQPWEKYTTKNGRETFILYSMGNFVAGQSTLATKTGVVAYLGLSKKANHKATIYGVAYTPVYNQIPSTVPVGKSDHLEVINHVISMFGNKKRIEPDQALSETMCGKK